MTAPAVAGDARDLHALLADAWTTPGRGVALVPTMGALHEGHASLLRRARELAHPDGLVVASVFVNPLQFGVGEDLDRYPRTLDADLELCAREGVDVVFAPTVETMYPTWPQLPGVTVDPGPLGDVLEGRTRPGHFRGVLTVVARLLALVRPTCALFGEKDYQQLALIREMAGWIRPEVGVAGVPTVREPDGLAMSSRNRYLDAEERVRALALSRALRAVQAAAADGAAAALEAGRAVLRDADGVDVDYLVLTDPDLRDLPVDLPADLPVDLPADVPTAARALVAARVGSTRLIDNLPVHLGHDLGHHLGPREGTP